ncbi:hypothetical protein Aph01nite_36180 [Acrocarpospora phusangensis]|uniref:Uncharacterized protein n=1 Tax=Acrocarpospora phusangensis TaxID=1070424 RepID=A0A919UPF1_9ACTN|nr:hypothetical protein [Acrocarpospora phusangensis]GIH25308.1 hypothetical protein Aph01nite_36180 [Acrocarpospora phusangensis]
MKRSLEVSKAQLLNNQATSREQQVISKAPLGKAQPATLEIIATLDGSTGPLTKHPNFSGGRLQVVVGQRVRLGVEVRTAGGPQAHLSEINWTVGDGALGDCVQTLLTGTAVGLTPAQRAAGDISFYWISGGLKTVRVTARIGGVQASREATVDVAAPTVHYFRITTSNVTLCGPGQYHGDREKVNSWVALYEPQVGESGQRYGCSWEARVQAPSRQVGLGLMNARYLGAGSFGFIQTCGFDWTVSPVRNQGQAHIRTSLGSATATALDADDVKRDGSVLYTIEKVVTAGQAATIGPGPYFCDSPGYELPGAVAGIDGKDLFQLYLVYKPEGAHSIWVALRRADWSWQATVSRQDRSDGTSAWKPMENVIVSPNPHVVTSAQAAHGQPTWTERAKEILSRRLFPET